MHIKGIGDKEGKECKQTRTKSNRSFSFFYFMPRVKRIMERDHVSEQDSISQVENIFRNIAREVGYLTVTLEKMVPQWKKC